MRLYQTFLTSVILLLLASSVDAWFSKTDAEKEEAARKKGCKGKKPEAICHWKFNDPERRSRFFHSKKTYYGRCESGKLTKDGWLESILNKQKLMCHGELASSSAVTHEKSTEHGHHHTTSAHEAQHTHHSEKDTHKDKDHKKVDETDDTNDTDDTNNDDDNDADADGDTEEEKRR